AGMLAFSGTFALPFFFLALFPKLIAGLPRSGGWLAAVKVILGFVELAAAFKFLVVFPHAFTRDELPLREVVLAIWGLTFVAASLYLLGKIRFPHDSPPQRISPARVALMALFLAITGYCLTGVGGMRLNANLEAQILSDSLYERERIPWRVLSQETGLSFADEIAKIRARGQDPGPPKPIFINFTGHT
ncbi:MAG: hypothetical protein ACE5GW_05605, partial [Planctomycetota bacterium]